MRPSPPWGTTGEGEYSPGDARDGVAAGTVKCAYLVFLVDQKASRFTRSTRVQRLPGPPPDPQERAPAPPQSSTPDAGPSYPRANQVRTPPTAPRSTGGSEQAPESATSVPHGLAPP